MNDTRHHNGVKRQIMCIYLSIYFVVLNSGKRQNDNNKKQNANIRSVTHFKQK